MWKKNKSEDKIKKVKDILGFDFKFKKKKKTTFNSLEVIFLVIIASIFSMMGGMIFGGISNQLEEKPAIVKEYGSELEKFIEQYTDIKENYYGDFDEVQFFKDALSGITNATGDPHSIYMDEEEAKDFNFELAGEFDGLGVRIMKREANKIEVLEVFDNSPASRAGLKVGDFIIKVDDLTFEQASTVDFVEKVQNSKTGTVSLILERNGKEVKTSITKGKVIIPSVKGEMLDEKVGYIKIDIFAVNTGGQLITELNKLESQGLKSLIIDLRGNTGGHLSSAQTICSQFLDSSNVIFQTENNEGLTVTKSSGSKTKDYKIVILQDGGSASASEVLIGALNDNLEVTLVGTKTFGKGSVQEIKYLSDGTQIKYTTARWLTPGGDSIDKKGIEPDVEILLNEEFVENPIRENDSQFQKAYELAK